MNQQKRGTAGKAVPLFDWVRSEGEALIEEGQTERAGAGVGADDTADLAHKGLVPAQILLQTSIVFCRRSVHYSTASETILPSRSTSTTSIMGRMNFAPFLRAKWEPSRLPTMPLMAQGMPMENTTSPLERYVTRLA